jgi:ferrous iron transport protein A
VDELVPINLLLPGQSAQIEVVLGTPEQVHRMEEIGLRDGADVQMMQPGSPCIIRLGGQRLCFRADEAMSVLVRPTHDRARKYVVGPAA